MRLSNNGMGPSAVLLSLFITATVTAQIAENSRRNNPYSPSPTGQSWEKQMIASSKPTQKAEVVFTVEDPVPFTRNEPTGIDPLTAKNAAITASRAISLTEACKVGVGDVIIINLKNAPQGSSYCTVRPDGTIDFPLAGENIIVADKTTDTIAEMIASGITLFSHPQIEVTVREYASHKITVSGMVDNPGEKNLQREAMPLYAIRSEAVVSPKATKVVIKRAPLLKLESYDLSDAATDNVLIFPGNSIEFTFDSQPLPTYYMTGNVNLIGKRELTSGLTLYQAVIASGAATGKPKEATIRRKTDKGVFANSDYDLRAIKAGRNTDPLLEAGDVIEIRK